MPLPLIIGVAALATAAYGAKKGYDGYQKHSEADEVVKDAKSRYEKRRNIFDRQEKETTSALELLGKKELEIGESIGEFKTLADQLLQRINKGRQDKLAIKFPKNQLQKIENYSYTAVGVLGAVTGAGVAGAAVGFAVYGGVMALGAASTGTAISALSGVAATNATLAALGGGSLAAGGLGMAGGTAILGAAVAAPVLAIAGWAYDSHGEEALRNAYKVNNEVDAAVQKLIKACDGLSETKEYASRIKRELESIFEEFKNYFYHLKNMDRILSGNNFSGRDVEDELDGLSEKIIRIVENGYALAAILVELITTPLFKIKKRNGEVINNSEGVPEMEKDSDGSMILDTSALDSALQKAKKEARNIESA